MSTLPPSDSIDVSIDSVHLRTQYDPDFSAFPATGLRLSWRVDARRNAGEQLGYEVAWGSVG